MHDRWSDFVIELKSGEPNRVNGVLDELRDMSLDERIQLFEVSFKEVTQLYENAGDGYVRQSVVRFAEQLVPGIPTVMAVDTDDRSIRADEADIRAQTDSLCGFLLEALTDDDGRVRQSAKRGLNDVFRTYDALGDEETIAALGVELEEMIAETTGKQQQHLREAKEDAKFSLQSGVARILDGFQLRR